MGERKPLFAKPKRGGESGSKLMEELVRMNRHLDELMRHQQKLQVGVGKK